jgi:hypothetical protein
MCAACSHSRSQILSEVTLLRLAQAAKVSPVFLMRETLSEMACDENGKTVKRSGTTVEVNATGPRGTAQLDKNVMREEPPSQEAFHVYNPISLSPNHRTS